MKNLINANLLNNLWRDGVSPLKIALAEKLGLARILKTTEEFEANTDENNIPSSLLMRDILNKLNENFGGVRLGLTEDGRPGYVTTGEDGADAVVPFRDAPGVVFTNIGSLGTSSAATSSTFAHNSDNIVAMVASSYVKCTLTVSGKTVEPIKTLARGYVMYIFDVSVSPGDKINYTAGSSGSSWFKLYAYRNLDLEEV